LTKLTCDKTISGSTDSDTSQMDIKKRHMSADSILNSLNQQESMDVDVEGWYICT
jgi:hypothetical protein